MNNYTHTLNIVSLLCSLSLLTACSMAQANFLLTKKECSDKHSEDVKKSLANLQKDLMTLNSAIKNASKEQANAVITQMKDWVKKQEDAIKEEQAKLHDRMEQTRKKIQARIDEVARAAKTEDEAKVDALLQNLEDETNAALQELKDASQVVKQKIESLQKEAKANWHSTLEDLHTAFKDNVKSFTASLNEVKNYLKGFKDKTKKEIAKKLES